jgi:glycosyltransferase involved in cell wall biosynthesis
MKPPLVPKIETAFGRIMKILYDGLIYANQLAINVRAGGISRYFKNVIDHLPPECVPVLTSPEPFEFCFPSNPRLRCHHPKKTILGSGRLARMANLFHSTVTEKFQKFDLVHPTYHSLMSGKPMSSYRMPVVLTIHDMITEHFAAQLDPNGVETARKREAVQAADAIICVSENTKKDLMEMLRVPAERITVIPLASELSAEMALDSTLVPRKPYVLFVGSRAFYKNFVRLLLAFSKVSTRWPELRLAVVGAAFNQTENELIHALKLETKIDHLSQLNDQQLAGVYQNAEAFVYPSLYEGFGIPPLEAMACGTVVIAANSSSIPEVVGDAAILFDPNSTDELVERILAIPSLGGHREDYIQRGRKRAAQFSWKDTAEQTFQVYRRVVK